MNWASRKIIGKIWAAYVLESVNLTLAQGKIELAINQSMYSKNVREKENTIYKYIYIFLY